jgi:hypothetical protein
MRGAYRVVVRKPERKSHLRHLEVDGRIIIKLILKRNKI